MSEHVAAGAVARPWWERLGLNMPFLWGVAVLVVGASVHVSARITTLEVEHRQVRTLVDADLRRELARVERRSDDNDTLMLNRLNLLEQQRAADSAAMAELRADMRNVLTSIQRLERALIPAGAR